MRKRLSRAEVKLTEDLTRQVMRFEISMPRGSRVIRARTMFQAKKLIVAMDNPPLIPVLQIMLDVDVDSEVQRHGFVLLPEGVTVTPRQEIQLELVAVIDDPRTPDGSIALYQERRVRCDPFDPAHPERELEHVFQEGTSSCWCGTAREPVADPKCFGDSHAFVGGAEWCMCGVAHVSSLPNQHGPVS